jgi:TRAP-type uncharacterized transport system fused permease subunit
VTEKLSQTVDTDALIREFDSESNFRDLRGSLRLFVTAVCVVLSLFHIYTAGFGLLNEVTHRSVHMSFIMGLLFLVFPRRRVKRQGLAMFVGLGYGAFYLLIAHQLVTAMSGQLHPALSVGVYAFAAAMALSALPLRILLGKGDGPGRRGLFRLSRHLLSGHLHHQHRLPGADGLCHGHRCRHAGH